MTASNNPVVIGMDPHKRSVTIEVMDAAEQVLGGGRFPTSVEGFAALLDYVQAWPERVWAIEGCEGIGRHVAQRLLAIEEPVVDVPAKLSARMQVFATGQGRKPTTPTPTPSPWSGCGSTGCMRWSTTSSWRSCGCWSTAVAGSGKTTPG